METLDWVFLALTRSRGTEQGPTVTRRNLLNCYAHLLHQDLTEERRADFLLQSLWTETPAQESIEPQLSLLCLDRLSDRDRILLGWAHAPNLSETSLAQRGWTYERIGRVLGLSAEDVEERLWVARCRLHDWTHGSRPQQQIEWVNPSSETRNDPIDFQGPECPPWEPRAPWTQRWLDGTTGSGDRGRERLFLQSHLAHCGACRSRLDYTRQTFLACREQVAVALAASESDHAPIRTDFARILHIHKNRHIHSDSLLRSIVRFLGSPQRRPGILLWAVIVALWALTWLFH